MLPSIWHSVESVGKPTWLNVEMLGRASVTGMDQRLEGIYQVATVGVG